MELAEIFFIYSNRQPLHYDVKETSRGEADFRQAIIVDWGEEKRVIKIACNAFTTKPFYNNGRECVVFAEEFSVYQTAEQVGRENIRKNGRFLNSICQNRACQARLNKHELPIIIF